MMALSKEDALVIEDIKSETDFRCTPKNNRRNIVMGNSNGTRARRKSGLTKAELKRLNRQNKIKAKGEVK